MKKRKKSLTGWIDKDWELKWRNELMRWDVIDHNYIWKKEDSSLRQVKVCITIEEV